MLLRGSRFYYTSDHLRVRWKEGGKYFLAWSQQYFAGRCPEPRSPGFSVSLHIRYTLISHRTVIHLSIPYYPNTRFTLLLQKTLFHPVLRLHSLY